jgi:hypothetical protein
MVTRLKGAKREELKDILAILMAQIMPKMYSNS